jgi:hypothetical protein
MKKTRLTVKKLPWIDAQQRPSEVKRFLDRSGFIWILRNELAFKLLQELQAQLILRRQSFLTDDCLHGCCISTNGVFGILIDTLKGELLGEDEELLPTIWEETSL